MRFKMVDLNIKTAQNLELVNLKGVRDHSQSRMEAKPFDGLLERKRIDGLFY